MSALRHGKIGRAIMAIIEDDRKGFRGEPGSVLVTSLEVVRAVYNPYPTTGFCTAAECDALHRWEPTLAQRKAVTRAMRSLVRKHQQYALTGGQGRCNLYLYDTADPISVIWAKLWVDPKRKRGKFISRADARWALSEQAGA